MYWGQNGKRTATISLPLIVAGSDVEIPIVFRTEEESGIENCALCLRNLAQVGIFTADVRGVTGLVPSIGDTSCFVGAIPEKTALPITLSVDDGTLSDGQYWIPLVVVYGSSAIRHDDVWRCEPTVWGSCVEAFGTWQADLFPTRQCPSTPLGSSGYSALPDPGWNSLPYSGFA